MSKQAVFTMKLEPDLREKFMAEAEAMDRPASHVLRELMREFVRRQSARRDHAAFLRRKVDAARASVQGREGRPSEIVEAEFAVRRAGVSNRT